MEDLRADENTVNLTQGKLDMAGEVERENVTFVTVPMNLIISCA